MTPSYLKYTLFICWILIWLNPIRSVAQVLGITDNGFSATQNVLIDKICDPEIGFLEKEESIKDFLLSVDTTANVKIIGENGTLLNILPIKEFFKRLKFMEYGNCDEFEISVSLPFEIYLKYMNPEEETLAPIVDDEKDINKVTIDGKTFFGSDPKAATKNLPAEGISKVDTKTEEEETTGLNSQSEDNTNFSENDFEFKAISTGRTTGHIGDLVITSVSDKTKKIALGSYIIPSKNDHQAFVVYEKKISEVRIPAGAIFVHHLHGYCINVERPPVAKNREMPHFSEWLRPKDYNQEFVKSWKNTDNPDSINFDEDLHLAGPLLIEAVVNLEYQYTRWKEQSKMPDLYSNDSIKTALSLIQQSFWQYSSALRHKNYTYDDFRTVVFQQNAIDDWLNINGNNLITIEDTTISKKEFFEKQTEQVWNAITDYSFFSNPELGKFMELAEEIAYRDLQYTYVWESVELTGELSKINLKYIAGIVGGGGVVTGAILLTTNKKVLGCTNPSACNYNENSTEDDGSCMFEDCLGDCGGNNVIGASCDDGNVNTISDTYNFSCTCLGVEIVMGCTNSCASNFNTNANVDDGTCILQEGCTEPAACNYDASACVDDGSCDLPPCNSGCTDICSSNYDPNATIDDESCEPYDFTCNTDCTIGNIEVWNASTCSCVLTSVSIKGCLSVDACNYNPNANCDDGSCNVGNPACTDPCNEPNPDDGCDLTTDNYDATTCTITNIYNCPTDTFFYTTLVDEPITIFPLFDNTNPVSIEVSPLNNGTVFILQDGTLNYTPNSGFEGTDTFMYFICDIAMPPICDTTTIIMLVDTSHNNTNNCKCDCSDPCDPNCLKTGTIRYNENCMTDIERRCKQIPYYLIEYNGQLLSSKLNTVNDCFFGYDGQTIKFNFNVVPENEIDESFICSDIAIPVKITCFQTEAGNCKNKEVKITDHNCSCGTADFTIFIETVEGEILEFNTPDCFSSVEPITFDEIYKVEYYNTNIKPGCSDANSFVIVTCIEKVIVAKTDEDEPYVYTNKFSPFIENRILTAPIKNSEFPETTVITNIIGINYYQSVTPTIFIENQTSIGYLPVSDLYSLNDKIIINAQNPYLPIHFGVGLATTGSINKILESNWNNTIIWNIGTKLKITKTIKLEANVSKSFKNTDSPNYEIRLFFD